MICSLSDHSNCDDLECICRSCPDCSLCRILRIFYTSWQDFNWQSMSYSPSAITELLVDWRYSSDANALLGFYWMVFVCSYLLLCTHKDCLFGICRQSLKKPNARLTRLVWATNRSHCIPESCSSASPTWQTSTRCISTHWRGSSTCLWCPLTTPRPLMNSQRGSSTCRIILLTCCTATSASRCLKRTRYRARQ